MLPLVTWYVDFNLKALMDNIKKNPKFPNIENFNFGLFHLFSP